MGQNQYRNDDERGPDGIGSPQNLNDLKKRGVVKSFGDRKDVNPMISGKSMGKARAGSTWPADKEKPR
jgi:hypothetical protein